MRTRDPKQRELESAHVSMEPVRGFERSQTELQEAIFARYIDNRSRQHKASLNRKKLERYAAELRDPFFHSRFPVTFQFAAIVNEHRLFLFFFFFFLEQTLDRTRFRISADFSIQMVSRLVHYGGMKLSVTHANRVHVGVKRAVLMMKSWRINTVLCEV